MKSNRIFRVLAFTVAGLVLGVVAARTALHHSQQPANVPSLAPTAALRSPSALRPAELLPNLSGAQLLKAVPPSDGRPFGGNYGSNRYRGTADVRNFAVDSRGYLDDTGESVAQDGLPLVTAADYLPARGCTTLPWSVDWFTKTHAWAAFSLAVTGERDLEVGYTIYQTNVKNARKLIDVFRSAKNDCAAAANNLCQEPNTTLQREPSPDLGDVTLIYADYTSISCRHVEAYAFSSPFLITLKANPDDPAYADADHLPAVLEAVGEALGAAGVHADATLHTTFTR